MQTSDKWRKWTPANDGDGIHEESEPTKLTEIHFGSFVSSASRKDQENSRRSSNATEDFNRWLFTNCKRGDYFLGEIALLHIKFCEAQASRFSPMCSRRVFEGLLLQVGFSFVDGLVAGLVVDNESSDHDKK